MSRGQKATEYMTQ
jgi:hypothetical protein